MGREEFLLQGITKDQCGIEIAPWFRPLVPKRTGYNSLSLDLFDRDELLRRAAGDPNISPNDHWKIESVDIVGSASDIGDLVNARGLAGSFNYIISSHNFEHLPDPIRFLNGCADALKPDGVISMAIPDKRACFDYFRPQSMTGELIAAYMEKRNRPTPSQRFAYNAFTCRLDLDTGEMASFWLGADPNLIGAREIAHGLRCWDNPDEYWDTHCWTFTPASFRLLMLDLQFLGLISLVLEDINGPNNDEFYVRLRNPLEKVAITHVSFYRERNELLHLIGDEVALSSRLVYGLKRDNFKTLSHHRVIRRFIGVGRRVARCAISPWATNKRQKSRNGTEDSSL